MQYFLKRIVTENKISGQQNQYCKKYHTVRVILFFIHFNTSKLQHTLIRLFFRKVLNAVYFNYTAFILCNEVFSSISKI